MTRKETLQLLDVYFAALKAGCTEDIPFTHDITFEGPKVGTVHGETEVRKLVAEVSGSFQNMELRILGHVIDEHEVCTRAELVPAWRQGGCIVGLLPLQGWKDFSYSTLF
ncbi:nuclear transport factor 2 family protein [Desulfobacterales bacterium HSG2]|nr:nuclear transport factor 2 family protein [Desulfobacterales bacterium HSG2]